MITNDLIYVKSLETGVNYAINLRKVVYYEVGVYKRKRMTAMGAIATMPNSFLKTIAD